MHIEDERRTRNVNGKAGKEELSPNWVEALKKAVFSKFPLEGWEMKRTLGLIVLEPLMRLKES